MPAAAQDAPDDGGIHFFGNGEVENRGAGGVAGEDALIARGEGGRGWHRRILDEC